MESIIYAVKLPREKALPFLVFPHMFTIARLDVTCSNATVGVHFKRVRFESQGRFAQAKSHESEISAHRGAAARPGESGECEHIRMYKANPTQVGGEGRTGLCSG